LAGMEEYTFDDFNDGSDEIVREDHLNKLREFVEKYGNTVVEIEEALLATVWDYTTDPLSLNFTPYEQTNILQLVRTDNKIFNKVVIVFASLCAEMQQLKEIVIS
jgi:WASH complex subunit 7